MRKRAAIPGVIAAGLLLATAAYADPYNPAERANGGGLLGAGTGAVISEIASGGMALASVWQWAEAWVQ